MNLPLFIARRTATTKSSTQSTMVTIATIAVAVSIAVMVITTAVVAGFKSKIESTIRDLSADITVTDLAALYGSELRPINSEGGIHDIFSRIEGIEHIESYALRGCVARTQSAAAGIVLKGVEQVAGGAIAQALVEGQLPRTEGVRRKEILIAQDIAQKLSISCGQKVELININGGEATLPEVFKVCGIYRPMGHYPVSIALTDIRNVQKSNGWESKTVSGFEIYTSQDIDAEAVSDRINMQLFEEYMGDENLSAISAKELYRNIFAWLDTHNINATVITVIMFVVALFNMVTALLILLFERTRMVGVLKSLGMNNRKIREIFLYQAAAIVGKGMAIGNACALVVVLVQKHFGVIKLDESAYIVSQVPISLSGVEVIIINVIFAAAILSLLFVATAIVSRIEPSQAVKYE